VERAKRLVAQMEKALAAGGGTHSLLDVTRALKLGKAQAFTQNDSIVVTEILQSSLGKTMIVWLAAGDIEDVEELQEAACKAATEFGCKRAIFNGRKGWMRHFLPEKYGWIPQYVGFVRQLSGE